MFRGGQNLKIKKIHSLSAKLSRPLIMSLIKSIFLLVDFEWTKMERQNTLINNIFITFLIIDFVNQKNPKKGR